MRFSDLPDEGDQEPVGNPDEPPPDQEQDDLPSVDQTQADYVEQELGVGSNVPDPCSVDGDPPPDELDLPPQFEPSDLSAEEVDEERAVGRAIETSLDETGQAIWDWALETGLELAAEFVHPGLGHLISIGFKVKEAAGDVEALANPESGSDVHVPLLSIPPGFEIELSLHLPGHDRAGTDGPWVSGFLSPGDGGLFGGWAIEREEGPAEAEQNAQRTDQDAGQVPETVIQYPLAKKMDETDPLRRAAHLREAAPRMLRRLKGIPRYRLEPVIVIYDEEAGCGLWMIRRELADAIAGRRIEIRYEYSTGLMSVSII